MAASLSRVGPHKNPSQQLKGQRAAMRAISHVLGYVKSLAERRRRVSFPSELGADGGSLPAGLPKPTRDTFCILAWNHLQIAPNGTVKMCCIANEDISHGNRPMSLYTDTYEDIWNSELLPV